MSIEVHSADTVSQVGAVLTGSAKYFAGGTLLMRQVCLLYTSPSPRDRG